MDKTRLEQSLTEDEGVRLFVYDDATGLPIRPGTVVKGHPTIGIGRALDVEGLAPAEVQGLLADDVAPLADRLTAAFPWFAALDDVRQRVLAEMAFNLGLDGLSGFRLMLQAIQARNWPAAVQQMRESAWSHQVGARSLKLERMMLTGGDLS